MAGTEGSTRIPVTPVGSVQQVQRARPRNEGEFSPFCLGVDVSGERCQSVSRTPFCPHHLSQWQTLEESVQADLNALAGLHTNAFNNQLWDKVFTQLHEARVTLEVTKTNELVASLFTKLSVSKEVLNSAAQEGFQHAQGAHYPTSPTKSRSRSNTRSIPAQLPCKLWNRCRRVRNFCCPDRHREYRA